jgi:UDP-N-acetylmuramate: L-alanyl-gamma-D-glutamyl-meso-diaminopimelate ligase
MMMNREGVKRFYFVGICGTAMGSVAAALQELGHEVSGSDHAVYPPMSDFLASRGVRVFEGYDAAHVPVGPGTVIVIGNAVSRGNPEVEAVLDRKLRYVSLPEALKEHFLQGKRNLVVTGTHGKTTTTSILAWLLECGGARPDFLIGGLPANFGKGCRLGGDTEFVVLEGDEYDTAFFDKRSKFVHYLPEIVVVNNIEYDHADIFEDLRAVKLAFRRLLNIVPRNGTVILNGDDPACLEVGEGCWANVVRVGFGDGCDFRIEDLEEHGGTVGFRIGSTAFALPMSGVFNARNAAMALAAARAAGMDWEGLRAALPGFRGVARRQEVRGETARGIVVIDDFGHHPTAMRQALAGLRVTYPGRRLWAIFEPRSNTTRRRVFQDALPEALEGADGVCIASVPNPEKVPPEQRLDPGRVADRLREMGIPAFHEEDADAIVARMRGEARDGDVLVVFSNGGFGGIHGKLLAAL